MEATEHASIITGPEQSSPAESTRVAGAAVRQRTVMYARATTYGIFDLSLEMIVKPAATATAA